MGSQFAIKDIPIWDIKKNNNINIEFGQLLFPSHRFTYIVRKTPTLMIGLLKISSTRECTGNLPNEEVCHAALSSG